MEEEKPPTDTGPQHLPERMSETEIRDAGLAIDVPFEAPPPTPQGAEIISYQDGQTLEDELRKINPERYGK